MNVKTGWLVGIGSENLQQARNGIWSQPTKKEVGFKNFRHLDGVAVDDRPVLLEVLGGEAALVDDLHLLHDRALARLSRT